MSASERTPEAQEFLRTLDVDLAWQWFFEKWWRRGLMVYHLASWAIRLLILAITAFQMNTSGAQPPPWLLFVLTALALLNVALPQLGSTFKIQQRQEVYDAHAREYSAIRVEFLTGQIDLATAVAHYTELRRKPTESVIRNTP
jgi:hypothetical protein